MSEWHRIVRVGDLHVPFEDKQAVAAALNFCKLIQPDEIVFDELHDFYAISKFNKDPGRITSLQSELDLVEQYIKEFRGGCPNSRFVVLRSNHLDRLKKFLWREAPALASLRCLELEELLQLKKHDVVHADIYRFRNFLFKHGDIVRKHSAYTAHGEYEREGTSGMSGHTHRAGVYYTTKRGGNYVWVESGCLCSLKPEYLDGIPNWQHAIGLVQFKKNTKHFAAMPLPVIDGEVLWS